MNMQKSQVAWTLLLISFAVYLPSLNNGFALDDAIVLTENSYTQSANLQKILSKDTFAGFFIDKPSIDLVEGGRYRPLTLVLFAGLWKVCSDPFIYHLINVMFYALTVVLIFIVMLRLLESAQPDKHRNTFVSASTALIFALHPVHTEVVNNIKSLDEIMSLFFALLAWFILLKPFQKAQSLKVQTLTSLLFLAAMLAKETAVVMLPIIAISLFVFQNKQIITALKKITPIVIGLMIYLILRYIVLGDTQSFNTDTEPLNNPFLKYINNEWVPYSWSEKAGTILYSLGHYLLLLVMPVNLTHDYYPQVIPMTPLISWPALLSLLTYLTLLYLCFKGLIKKRYYAFGILTFLTAIFLFSNITFTIGTFMAERFLYVPSLGFAITCAWLLYALTQLKFNITSQKTRLSGTWVCGLIVIVAGGLSMHKIIDRSQDWSNNFSLFQADIATSAQSAKLQNALGGELISQSQQTTIKGTDQEPQMLKQAIHHLENAINIHPTYALAYMLKGNALHYSGEHLNAIKQFEKALILNPTFQDARKNLQLVQEHIKKTEALINIQSAEQQAQKYSEGGQHQNAIKTLSQLINQTQSSKHYFFRGITYANNNQLEMALHDFLQAEKIDTQVDSDNTLRILQAIHNTYSQLGETDLANQYLGKINRLKPNK